jgi:hypothetical protein
MRSRACFVVWFALCAVAAPAAAQPADAPKPEAPADAPKPAPEAPPAGKINVIGLEIDGAKIYIDGKLACERGPCLQALPEGEHAVRVERPGRKPFQRSVAIQARTETTLQVSLAPIPSRGNPVLPYVLAAGIGAAGGVLGYQANRYRDQLRDEIAAGNPPVDSRDDRFMKGRIFAIAADATFVAAGLTALFAVYNTFRDREGPPSTGLLEVRAVALEPRLGPGYAGLGMGGRW